MINIADDLNRHGLNSRMLMQVHDELVFEVAKGEEEALTRIVRERMGGAADLRVPLSVQVGVGANWDQAAH
jgi:DNA polymerase-1